MVYKISGNTLLRVVTVYENRGKAPTNCIRALDCFRCFGRKILWVGLDFLEGGYTKIYAFDKITEELEELSSKRVEHLEKFTYRLHRFGDQFFYIGYIGRIMRLSMEYQE